MAPILGHGYFTHILTFLIYFCHLILLSGFFGKCERPGIH